MVWVHEVAGSNPVTPIFLFNLEPLDTRRLAAAWTDFIRATFGHPLVSAALTAGVLQAMLEFQEMPPRRLEVKFRSYLLDVIG